MTPHSSRPPSWWPSLLRSPPTVPGLQAFMSRPLSNPRVEADGPFTFYVLIKEEFAPLQTRRLWPACLVTFIIHSDGGEPLSVAAPQQSEAEDERSEKAGPGGRVWWAPLIPALLQLPSQTGVQVPPHPQSFRQRQRRWSNSWVKPKFPAFHLKLLFLAPLLVFLLVTGTNHLDFLTSRLRRQQSSQGTLGLFKGQREDVCESSLCN